MLTREGEKWFSDAKFGLFIHFGLYAVLAGEYQGIKTENIAEWIMNDLDIPREEYEKLMKVFDPSEFNPKWLVEKVKSWGMKYIVITSKHHEGFAMWDSGCSEYKITNTPYGKDLIRELKEACDEGGIRLGFYYSQAQDWHDPDGFQSKLLDRHFNDGKDYQAYLERKCYPQLRELLTEYGDIALIWFDTPMDTTKEQSETMYRIVKELQPDCIVSGRIGNGLGEYMTTGDNFIPSLPLYEPWEVPATINGTWGYNKYDTNWKDPKKIIQLLVKINSRGGNYLLNVGPMADGSIPEKSVTILDEVGRYVKANEEAIIGTRTMPLCAYELDWCQLTRKPYHIYMHVFQPRQKLEMLNVANKVKRAYVVENGTELDFVTARTCEGDAVIQIYLPEEYKKKDYYVVALETEEEQPIIEPLH